MFQNEGGGGGGINYGRVLKRARYCEYGDFEDQACRDRFIADLAFRKRFKPEKLCYVRNVYQQRFNFPWFWKLSNKILSWRKTLR